MVHYYRPPTIKRVRIADPLIWSIQVTWEDGEEDIVSLNPVLEKRGSLRRRFERNPEKFWDVSIVDRGRALSWFNASIDISAQAIEDLVFAQQKKQDLAGLYDNSSPGTPSNARVTDTFDARQVDVSLDFRVTDMAA